MNANIGVRHMQFLFCLAIGLIIIAAGNLYGPGGSIVVAFGLLIYFLPTLVAYNRKPSNWLGIFALNVFLGWSFIGWVVALVWACAGENEKNREKMTTERERKERNLMYIRRYEDRYF